MKVIPETHHVHTRFILVFIYFSTCSSCHSNGKLYTWFYKYWIL